MPIDEKTIAFGEIGLSGEVRSVSMADQTRAGGGKTGFRDSYSAEGLHEISSV